MAGNNRPPYRTPCEGWQYAWPGKPHQNVKPDDKNVPQWQNVTDNGYPYPVGPQPVIRSASEQETITTTCTIEGVDCGYNCNEFPRVLRVTQQYEEAEPQDMIVCEKQGFKNLQMVKAWHGEWGFDCSNRTVKYRTRNETVTMNGTFHGGNPLLYEVPQCDGVPYSGTPPLTEPTVPSATTSISCTNTVVKNTGIINLDSLTASSTHAVNVFAYPVTPNYVHADVSYTSPNPASCPDINESLEVAMPTACRFGNYRSGCSGSTPIFTLYLPAPHGTYDSDPDSPYYEKYVIDGNEDNGISDVFSNSVQTWIGTLAEIENEMNNTIIINPHGGYFIEKPDFDDNASPTVSRCYNADFVPGATSMEFSYEMYIHKPTTSTDQWIDAFYTISLSLDNAYRFQDVIDDCKELAGQWDLSDDHVYPWRTDDYQSVAPIVSRDEVRGYTIASGYSKQCVEPIKGAPDWSVNNYASPINYDTPGHSYPPFSAEWQSNPRWSQITNKDPNSIVWDWSGRYYSATHNTAGGASYVGEEWQWNLLTDSEKSNYTSSNGVNYNRFTGNIIGSPSDKQGAQNFDYEHITWNGCAPSTAAIALFGSVSPYVSKIGAYSGSTEAGDDTDEAVPRAATQWTNNYDACKYRPGAWIANDGCIVVVQECIYTQVPRPSYNFARPCGEDRWSPDETKTDCIYEDDGTTVVLSSSSEVTSGQIAYIQSAVNPGIFKVNQISDTEYERIGDKIADLPYRFTPTETDNFFAPIRWQPVSKRTKPAICGRVKVISATQDGSDVIIESEAAASLVVHADIEDYVDFSGVSGLGTNVKVTEIVDSAHFKIIGTLSGAYVKGGYVSSNGAAAWYWNDDQSKGQYSIHEWVYNHASGAPVTILNGQPCASVVCETRCLPEINCYPSVVGWMVTNPKPDDATWDINSIPNASSLFYQGQGYIDDPNYIPFLWQAIVTFTMSDLLWQKPHKPKGADCNTNPDWVQDDGTCTKNYPAPPKTETFCELPSGVPALPDGITLPAYLPDAEIGGVYQSSFFNDVLKPNPFESEQALYLREKQCSCEGGSFAEEYERNKARCHC